MSKSDFRKRFPGHVKWQNRNAKLLRRYGISTSEYDLLLIEQDGKCAICRSESTGRKGSWNFFVDHDHSTGKVRGLLCHNCNTVLGKIRDSVNWLESAQKYLNSK